MANFTRTHVNGTFRWSVTVEKETVKVERTCINFYAGEYGGALADEFSASLTAAEFAAHVEAQSVVEQGFGTAVLDELLAHLGLPPSQRTPVKEPAPQVGPGSPAPALREPRSSRLRSLRAQAPALLLVLGLWAVTGLPGLGLMRDALGALTVREVPTQGVVLGVRSRGLVTHAVGGKGSSSPVRRYEGVVVVRVEGGPELTVEVTAPDIVRGEAVLQERLGAYREGAAVTLRCDEATRTQCHPEGESTAGSTFGQLAQLLFGFFLISLVPGLLALGLRLGRG